MSCAVSHKGGCLQRRNKDEGSRTDGSNEELFEGLLLHGERDISDAEAGAGDAEIGAAQLGVLLLGSPLTLDLVCGRHAVPGC